MSTIKLRISRDNVGRYYLERKVGVGLFSVWSDDVGIFTNLGGADREIDSISSSKNLTFNSFDELVRNVERTIGFSPDSKIRYFAVRQKTGISIRFADRGENTLHTLKLVLTAYYDGHPLFLPDQPVYGVWSYKDHPSFRKRGRDWTAEE